MTDNELMNEMFKRSEEFVENGKREFATEELKKIKSEILKDYPMAEVDNKAVLTIHGIHIALEYINEHITKLKGSD